MPNKRSVKKGSFLGHFDELITKFPEDARLGETPDEAAARKDKRHINDRLFEQAWSRVQH